MMTLAILSFIFGQYIMYMYESGLVATVRVPVIDTLQD